LAPRPAADPMVSRYHAGAALIPFTAWGCLVLPRRLRRVARAAHRAPPSDPPARATEQGVPRWGPSLFPASSALRRGQRHPPGGRPLGTRTLRRHRPLPAGRSWPPTPPPGEDPAVDSRHRQDPQPAAGPPTGGRGAFHPPLGW